MIEDALKVRDRETGKIYNAFVQAVENYTTGEWAMRWNIGINGYTEWHFIHAIYSNDDFNRMYEVIK